MESLVLAPLAANISAAAFLSFRPLMSRVCGSLSELMISVTFSVTRKRRFSSSRLVTLAKTVWPSWKTSAVSLKNRLAIAWGRGGEGWGVERRESSGLKLPGSDLMIWFCVRLVFLL